MAETPGNSLKIKVSSLVSSLSSALYKVSLVIVYRNNKFKMMDIRPLLPAYL